MPNVSTLPAPIRESPPISPINPDIPKQMILDFLKAFGFASQLTEAEKLQFVEVAQAFRLNPFRREIHCVVYGEGEYRRMSIVVGYQVYLDRAERTGKLDGWKAWVEGQGDDMKALVEIYRKDWSKPFVHEVFYREAVQKKKDGTATAFWSKQPRFQLRKVAISQGFRLAFPSELGGMPFDPAELPDGESIMPTATMTTQPNPPLDPDQSSESVGPVQNAAPLQLGLRHEPPEAPKAPLQASLHDRFQAYRDPYPGETQEDLITRLQAYLEDNADAFTDKHSAWVVDKARKSRDKEGVLKMLGYSEKVVRNVSAVAGASA